MWLKRDVVMLPTNQKASFRDLILYEGSEPKLFINDTSNAVFPKKAKLVKLYFLSDEEIKEGDWVYRSDLNIYFKATLVTNNYVGMDIVIGGEGVMKKYCKKIIATTDSSLTVDVVPTGFKSGVGALSHKQTISLPQPSPEFPKIFVEQYNKGNQITQVTVEYVTNHRNTVLGVISEQVLKVDKNNTISIRKLKENWSREEVVKEFHKFKKDIIENYHGQITNVDIYDWTKENL